MHKSAPTEAELIAPIRYRWSPHAFDLQQTLSTEQLEEVLEAARWASPCFNEQPWRYLVFDRHDALCAEVEACLKPTNQWNTQASHLIVICALRNFARNGQANRAVSGHPEFAPSAHKISV